jgi:hypothetical protein
VRVRPLQEVRSRWDFASTSAESEQTPSAHANKWSFFVVVVVAGPIETHNTQHTTHMNTAHNTHEQV